MTQDQCTRCLRKGHLAEDCKWPACRECTAAMTKQHWAGYYTHCLGCTARAIAHGTVYYQAAIDDAFTASYKAALQSSFGEDWRSAHDHVKAWAKRIQQGVMA